MQQEWLEDLWFHAHSEMARCSIVLGNIMLLGAERSLALANCERSLAFRKIVWEALIN